jgi:S-adenosylhomocysteine hydrolase
MSNSFTSQVLAQLSLWNNAGAYEDTQFTFAQSIWMRK